MDEQTKMALRRLASNTDFQRFGALLRAEQGEWVQLALNSTDEALVRQGQGGNKAIENVLGRIKQATEPPPARPNRKF